jgi:hypothetical protein
MSTYDFSNPPNLAASEAIKNTLKSFAQQSFSSLENSEYYEKLYWFRLKTDKTNSVKTLSEHYKEYLFYINPYVDNVGRGTRS